MSLLDELNPYSVAIKLAAKAAGVILVLFVVWWFGWHIPAKLKATKLEVQALTVQVEAARSAINLQNEIQKGHTQNDKVVQAQISTLRSVVRKPHTLLIHDGVVLPGSAGLRPAGTAR